MKASCLPLVVILHPVMLGAAVEVPEKEIKLFEFEMIFAILCHRNFFSDIFYGHNVTKKLLVESFLCFSRHS